MRHVLNSGWTINQPAERREARAVGTGLPGALDLAVVDRGGRPAARSPLSPFV